MNYNMFDEIDYFTNFKGNNNFFKENNSNDNESGENNLNYYLEIGNQGLDLTSPYEGYIKGNIFKNLYQDYKDLKPIKPRINNERDEMLLNISQMSFFAHELNLYLDNYNDNREAINLFNKYRNMTNDLIKNYERRYGPLTVSGDIQNGVPFKWVSEKWPWEN